MFQENQKKPPVPVPAAPEPEKTAPVEEAKKPEDKPEGKPKDEITVSQEPSTSLVTTPITFDESYTFLENFCFSLKMHL